MYIITIDGPAGSGKSTVAKLVSEKLKFQILNTGLYYRAFAYHYGNGEITGEKIKEKIKTFNLKVEHGNFILNGRRVNDELKTPATGQLASQVSQYQEVRDCVLPHLRAISDHSFVAEGRDTGSISFPHATLKVFLTASPEERAKRRHNEFPHLNFEQLKQEIITRDHQDSTRKVAPLIKTPDAIEIISDKLTLEDVANLIVKHFKEKIKA